MSGRIGVAGSATLAAAVVRGLRARSTLTLGCLLLAAVAIASAVLGPAYQQLLVAVLPRRPP